MRTLPHEHSVEMSAFTTQKESPMSRTRVNVHVRRSGAVVAGVLLLLTVWLPVATSSPSTDPSAANSRWMPAATSRYATGSLRLPDGRWRTGTKLDSGIDQQGGRETSH